MAPPQTSPWSWLDEFRICTTLQAASLLMKFRYIVLIIGGVVVLAWLTGGFFDATYVCTHCGAIRKEHRVLWLPFRKTQQTKLSIYLNSLTGSSPESHQWMSSGGHGGPITCALGSGRNLLRPVNSHEIIESLKAIRKHRGDAAARLWTERILDPKCATEAYMALYVLSDPTGNFDSDYADAVEEFDNTQISHSP